MHPQNKEKLHGVPGDAAMALDELVHHVSPVQVHFGRHQVLHLSCSVGEGPSWTVCQVGEDRSHDKDFFNNMFTHMTIPRYDSTCLNKNCTVVLQ